MQDTANLIAQLLTRELSGETREDLLAFQQDLRTGRLDDGDAAYVRALHQRIIGSDVVEIAAAPAADVLSDDVPTLQAQVISLRAENQSLNRALDEAREKIRSLEVGA